MSDLPAGKIIDIGPITGLAPFEAAVAHDLSPLMPINEEIAWSGRLALRELIRPPKINGTITNITMEAMEDPIAQMQTAHERGWKFSNRGGRLSKYVLEGNASAEHIRGFVFNAQAVSGSHTGTLPVEAEIWYELISARVNARLDGMPIHRAVSVPRLILPPQK